MQTLFLEHQKRAYKGLKNTLTLVKVYDMKSLYPANTINYEHEDTLNILVHKSHKESKELH